MNRNTIALTPLAIPPPIAYMSYVHPSNMRTKQEIETALRDALPGKTFLVLTGLKGPHIDRMLGEPSSHYVKVHGDMTKSERATVRAVLALNFGFEDNLSN